MKYTIEQKYNVIQRRKSILRQNISKELKLKESFPIEVEIKNGYYIIESKMNAI